ncbi:MAG TPA: response regulator [Acidimicrobiales bacterium]|nr:response regulator [Acidimicrobiales bacterium]
MGDRGAVRTVIVDDSADVRLMLRIMLSSDGRFDVVGEAADGAEAVDVCGRLRPDLVVLDRQMPVMGGLEAIPLIRARSPHSEIVLYTAALDGATAESAAAAGAIGVLHKGGVGADVAAELALMLARQAGRHATQPVAPAAPIEDVEVRVGPVPSEAARSWVANTRCILDAIQARPEAVGGPIDDSVMAMFRRFLDAWEAVARDTDVFFWTGRAEPSHVRQVIEEWVRIDSMDEATLEALGCHWAPPEAQPFFASLTAAVVEALAGEDEIRHLAERLGGEGPAEEEGREQG